MSGEAQVTLWRYTEKWSDTRAWHLDPPPDDAHERPDVYEVRTFQPTEVAERREQTTARVREWAQLPPTKWDASIRDGVKVAQAEILALLHAATLHQEEEG